MEKFLRDYGDRALAFITSAASLAGTMGVVSGKAALYSTFVGALATLAHTIFVKSSAEKELSKSG